MFSLIVLLIPALGLPIGLLCCAGRPGLPPLLRPVDWPWELWVLATCGTLATLSGWLDRRYHRAGGRPISPKERVSERWALTIGAMVFVLMAYASVSSRPGVYLLPVIALAIAATALICYDEFFFHRSCTSYETTLHRVLVFGNGSAWLAWCHWCFVRGGADA